MKILMVCLGNICRSPLAEGILQHKAMQKGLPWKVESAGTSDWHVHEAPDLRSQQVAKKYGIDISNQRSRMFQGYDFDRFDFIYAMDAANKRDILAHAKSEDEIAKVRLILDEIHPGENRGVPDPYWDDDGFEKVFKMLDSACTSIIDKYANQSSQVTK